MTISLSQQVRAWFDVCNQLWPLLFQTEDPARRHAHLGIQRLKRDFAERTRPLAAAAEAKGISSQPLHDVAGHVEGASDEQWNQAWAVVKRLEAISAAESEGESPGPEPIPLDELPPLDAMQGITLAMCRELDTWKFLCDLSEADLDGEQRQFVTSIHASVRRFNAIQNDFNSRVSAVLPALARVHAPGVVETGDGFATCYTEAMGEIFHNIYIVFKLYGERMVSAQPMGNVNPELVLSNWDAVRKNIPQKIAFKPSFLAASLKQEYLLAQDTMPAQVVRQETAAVRANTSKLFPKGVPENSNIVDLVVRLDAARGTGCSEISIAREFFGESEGNDPKSRSHMSQIRRMRRKGRITH